MTTLSTEELQYGNARCIAGHPLWLVAEGYARCVTGSPNRHYAWRFTSPGPDETDGWSGWNEANLLDGSPAWVSPSFSRLNAVLAFIQADMDASVTTPTVAVPLGPSLAEWQTLHRAPVEEPVS